MTEAVVEHGGEVERVHGALGEAIRIRNERDRLRSRVAKLEGEVERRKLHDAERLEQLRNMSKRVNGLLDADQINRLALSEARLSFGRRADGKYLVRAVALGLGSVSEVDDCPVAAASRVVMAVAPPAYAQR